jgi:hypothetical protein
MSAYIPDIFDNLAPQAFVMFMRGVAMFQGNVEHP